MAPSGGGADLSRVRARPLLAILVGALCVAALVGAATKASARAACGAAAHSGGYSYAGHQATYRGHGVRATITATRTLAVEAGHVAGWVDRKSTRLNSSHRTISY